MTDKPTDKLIEKLVVLDEYLSELYPSAECALEYKTPWQLLVAARLSAQCTDARVNIVTKTLFERLPDACSTWNSSPAEIAELIKSCGLGNTKARDIHAAAGEVLERFGGELPQTMSELLSISGVGRKIANLLLGDLFGQPAIVVDTHFMRITQRVGLTTATAPPAIERELAVLFEAAGLLESSSAFCHRIVWFGREVCEARRPKCEYCNINTICKYYEEIDN